MLLFKCITIGTLFEHFYKKKPVQINNKNTYVKKESAKHYSFPQHYSSPQNCYLFFQVYFLLLLAALSNSLSFKALL